MSNYTRGRRREWIVRNDLRRRGYAVIRSAGSKGVIDLLAYKHDDVIAVQVKSSPSAARAALRDMSALQQDAQLPRAWKCVATYVVGSTVYYVPPLDDA